MSPLNKTELREEKVTLTSIALFEKQRQGQKSVLNSPCYLILDLVRTE